MHFNDELDHGPADQHGDQVAGQHGGEHADLLAGQLGSHLSRRLDPHVGRSRRSFDAMLKEQARQQRRRIGWRMAIGSAGLIAACVAIAWGGWAVHSRAMRTPVVQRDLAVGPAVQAVTPAMAVGVTSTAPSAIQSGPQDVERVVTWQTLDDGMEVLDGKTPMRKLRREEVEQVQWFDPEQKATIRMTIPREQTVLVEMKTF